MSSSPESSAGATTPPFESRHPPAERAAAAQAVPLAEEQAALSLFAEAITGRPVEFAVVDDGSTGWPLDSGALIRSGEHGAIFVPVAVDDRADFRAVVLHQILADRSTSTVDSLSDQLFRLAESHRVVSVVQRDFPGAMSAQRRLMAQARRNRNERFPGFAASDRDILLHVLVVRAWGADDREVGQFPQLQAAPELADVARGLLSELDRVQAAGSTAATSRAVADRLLHMLVGRTRMAGVRNDPEDDPEADGSDAFVESDHGVSLDPGTPTEMTEGDAGGSGQLAGDLGDVPIAPDTGQDRELAEGGLQVPATIRDRSSGEIRTFVYDEWDYHLGRHRRAWCRVNEERLVGADHGFIADVRSRYGALRKQLRSSLLQMPRQELMRVRRSLDGEELDLDAAIEAVTDRRAGAPVDDRVGIRRDRAARDVATAFLVDLSASTSSPAVPPEPVDYSVADPMDDPYEPLWAVPPEPEPFRRIIDVAKDAVTLMGDTLAELGDRHAIYGFSGTGRHGVEFKIGKDFADRATPSHWAAVAAMKPLRYTRMGPAVRHATAKLAAEQARTKLLIVVSDGYPQDTDYGLDRTDRDYGIHDTARALADAARAGVETFCLTIDPAGHDYLAQMCPEDRYLVIEEVETLPEQLARCMLALRR